MFSCASNTSLVGLLPNLRLATLQMWLCILKIIRLSILSLPKNFLSATMLSASWVYSPNIHARQRSGVEDCPCLLPYVKLLCWVNGWHDRKSCYEEFQRRRRRVGGCPSTHPTRLLLPLFNRSNITSRTPLWLFIPNERQQNYRYRLDRRNWTGCGITPYPNRKSCSRVKPGRIS